MTEASVRELATLAMDAGANPVRPGTPPLMPWSMPALRGSRVHGIALGLVADQWRRGRESSGAVNVFAERLRRRAAAVVRRLYES